MEVRSLPTVARWKSERSSSSRSITVVLAPVLDSCIQGQDIYALGYRRYKITRQDWTVRCPCGRLQLPDKLEVRSWKGTVSQSHTSYTSESDGVPIPLELE